MPTDGIFAVILYQRNNFLQIFVESVRQTVELDVWILDIKVGTSHWAITTVFSNLIAIVSGLNSARNFVKQNVQSREEVRLWEL